MYCYVDRSRKIIAKISIVIKSQYILKIRSCYQVEDIFPVINGSFAKYHSLSPKFKQDYEKKKYNFSGHCINTCILGRKCLHEIPNTEIKNNEVDNEECFKEIANGNLDIERKLKIIEFEINVDRQYFQRIPKKIKKKEWQDLLYMESKYQRIKYLNYLFKKEMQNNSEKHKLRVQKRVNVWNEKKKEHNILYGIENNSLFLRVYLQSINRQKNLKLDGALCYSQHIVFDCSYGNFMSQLNKKFCAKQIMTAYASNRDHLAPFHIKLCNANPEDGVITCLSKMKNDIYMDITSQSYLDLYPKEKLVYLTPHCQETMDEFNDDYTYIIGAFVDRGTGGKVSLAKAKENKIRMAKFPLDKYLIWQRGTKSLPLNIVLDILADMRLHGNWTKAFEHIPRRFININDENLKKKKRNFNL